MGISHRQALLDALHGKPDLAKSHPVAPMKPTQAGLEIAVPKGKRMLGRVAADEHPLPTLGRTRL